MQFAIGHRLFTQHFDLKRLHSRLLSYTTYKIDLSGPVHAMLPMPPARIYIIDPKTPGYVGIQREDFSFLSFEPGCVDASIPRGPLSHYRVNTRPIPSTRHTPILYTFRPSYRSLKTLGFHPSFNSSSRPLISSFNLTSDSILSLALNTLLCK